MAENVTVQMESLNVGGNPLAEAEALFGEVNEGETIVRTVERTIEAKRESFKSAGDVAREHAAYLAEIAAKLKQGAELFVKKYNAQVDAIADCLMDINHSYSFLHYLSLTKQRPGGPLAMERARAEARANREKHGSGSGVDDIAGNGGSGAGGTPTKPNRRSGTVLLVGSEALTGSGVGNPSQHNGGTGVHGGGEAVAETAAVGNAESGSSEDDSSEEEGTDVNVDAETSSAPSAFVSAWDGEVTTRSQKYNVDATGMLELFAL